MSALVANKNLSAAELAGSMRSNCLKDSIRDESCNKHGAEQEAARSDGRQATLEDQNKRSLEELVEMLKVERFDASQLSNEELVELVRFKLISVRRLEALLGRAHAKRCVEIRRQYYVRELELLDREAEARAGQGQSGGLSKSEALKRRSPAATSEDQFDYSKVIGACCENVIGCVRLPVGLAGPLLMDGQVHFVPLATTEGCLVASTSRGLSVLSQCGGVISRVRRDCMTRAPIVRFADHSLRDALANVDRAVEWLGAERNKEKIRSAFCSTSKHMRLVDYTIHPIGREIHIRFAAQTGDAMGMNMCSKGAERALGELQRNFPTMDILTLSGNLCTDKKPSAVNWILGRGKSVECSASLSAEAIETLKVSPEALYEVWLKKDMVGSAMAGSLGGFNCHAANIVAAIFIATGQDVAHVVSSSNCLLELELNPRKASLEVHCLMPSIECGTVGGGTILSDQAHYLQLMGVRGPTESDDFERDDGHACRLARIVCSTVMAAELSLLASLTEGSLVRSHMAHNRSVEPCKVV